MAKPKQKFEDRFESTLAAQRFLYKQYASRFSTVGELPAKSNNTIVVPFYCEEKACTNLVLDTMKCIGQRVNIHCVEHMLIINELQTREKQKRINKLIFSGSHVVREEAAPESGFFGVYAETIINAFRLGLRKQIVVYYANPQNKGTILRGFAAEDILKRCLYLYGIDTNEIGAQESMSDISVGKEASVLVSAKSGELTNGGRTLTTSGSRTSKFETLADMLEGFNANLPDLKVCLAKDGSEKTKKLIRNRDFKDIDSYIHRIVFLPKSVIHLMNYEDWGVGEEGEGVATKEGVTHRRQKPTSNAGQLTHTYDLHNVDKLSFDVYVSQQDLEQEAWRFEGV